MFSDAWDMKSREVGRTKEHLKKEVSQLQAKIDRLLGRLVDAENASVVSAYENRIDRMQHEKRILEDRLHNTGKSHASFEETFELALRFLANPLKIWQSGQLDMQRLVLRLAFSEPISYCRKTGLQTVKTALPFNALGSFSLPKAEWWSLGGSNP